MLESDLHFEKQGTSEEGHIPKLWTVVPAASAEIRRESASVFLNTRSSQADVGRLFRSFSQGSTAYRQHVPRDFPSWQRSFTGTNFSTPQPSYASRLCRVAPRMQTTGVSGRVSLSLSFFLIYDAHSGRFVISSTSLTSCAQRMPQAETMAQCSSRETGKHTD